VSLPLPFTRGRDGVVVEFIDYERDVLAALIGDLRDLLMVDDHPALRRVKPPARPDDAEAEAGYRAMVDDDLLRGRFELLDVVEEGIEGTVLDEAGVAAWMQSLNMMRLILGERLSQEGVDLESDDLPTGPVTSRYEWLGQLLGLLVAAAEPDLPGPEDKG
jgi:hypothetical protein